MSDRLSLLLSRIKKATVRLLPPIVIESYRSWPERYYGYKARRQLLSGKAGIVPHSAAYGVYRRLFIERALNDPRLTETFRAGKPLPPSYGIGLDERCVEYPWLIANTTEDAGRWLDAGSCLNYDFVIRHPRFQNKRLFILTLAPEQVDFLREGVSYVYHDLRAIPFQDGYFDGIACLSTLEHVGFDNTQYTRGVGEPGHEPEGYATVMPELGRVLKPGGTLLFTVPFGRCQEFPSFQQFDSARLARAIRAFGPARRVTKAFYRYSRDGWRATREEECAECEYVAWTLQPRERWPRPLPVEPDRAAAARAVACVALIKP